MKHTFKSATVRWASSPEPRQRRTAREYLGISKFDGGIIRKTLDLVEKTMNFVTYDGKLVNIFVCELMELRAEVVGAEPEVGASEHDL